MKYIDTILSEPNALALELTLMQCKRLVENFGRGGHYNLNFAIPPIVSHGSDDGNIEYNVIYNYGLNAFSYSSTGAPLFDAKLSMHHVKTKLTIPTNGRVAVIRLKERCDNKNGVQDFGDQVYTDRWLFISNTPSISYVQPSPIQSLGFDYRFDTSDGSQLYRRDITGGFTPYGGTSGTNALFNQTGTGLVFNSFDDNNKANLITLGNRIISALSSFSVSRWAVNVPLSNACVSCSEFGGSYVTWVLPTVIPNTIPIYDARNEEDTSWIDNVYDYIVNGNRHGDVDPFIPDTPEAEPVTDFTSNFKTFITNKDNLGHVQFKTVCYNTQYMMGGDSLGGSCVLKCRERYFTSGGDPKPWLLVGEASQSVYPTITLDHGFSTVEDGEMWEVLYTFESLVEQDEHGHALGGFGFSVRYIHDNSKENRVRIESVRLYPNFITQPTTFAMCTWSQIVDGVKYVNTNYNVWHEIYFRAIGMDDLSDEYPNPDDSEDDRTGTDSTFIVGNGLNTFPITNAQFGQINKKLWSTDWTQVFKSSSIDPIRCVIGCKGIPFTATPSAMEHIIIANLDTGVDANTCNPVKSFDVGTVAMPSFRGDFSDITMTRVHLYLPFIGWVDLPSSEVISRVAHSDVGITANTKRLRFKYVVDFVDGSCRCIVSVNGTERWYFDGHCDVDVPVTSDNHTQAVGNAIRSGMGTALSVMSAVGGAIAENPMMIATGLVGAISNGANIIPTYNYSASSSPSGYINASMNNHIMIVIEHPNLVIASDFAHKNGRPCGLTLSLGSLRGYTRCINVDTSGINGTETELSMIKSMLESGVYL